MEILITSIVAFFSSNIDDIFILILFYGDKRFKDKEILLGQFLGISFLIAISILGSLVGLFIDQAYIGLLGLIPVYLGARSLVALFKGTDENDNEDVKGTKENKNNILTVAGVTMANGGDNVGIYIPLFAVLNWSEKFSMVTIFLLLTLLWCAIAKYLVKHPYVAKSVDKYGHIITPFVLVLLGLYIIFESGASRLFWVK